MSEPNSCSIPVVKRNVWQHLKDHKGALCDLDQADVLLSKRMSGDYKGALLDLDRADMLVPNEWFTLSERGAVKQQLEDHQGALLDLDRADMLLPSDRFTLSERGAVKQHLKDHKGALLDLDRVDVLVPNNWFTLSERGAVKRQLEDHQGALLDLDRADVLVPNDWFTLSERGVVKRRLKDHKGALLDLDRANVLIPNSWFTLLERGVVKRQLEDQKGALLDLDQADVLVPNDRFIILKRRVVQQRLEDYKGALLDLNQADVLVPNDKFTFLNRGVEKQRLEDYKEALLDLDQTNVRVPNDRFTFLKRGFVKRRLEDYKGALLDLDRADMLVRNDWFTLFERGAVKRRLEDHKGALLDLDRVDLLLPNAWFTLSERGAVKRLLGDYKGALLDLDRADVLLPNAWFTLSERGAVKRRLEDNKGALLDLDRADMLVRDHRFTLLERGAVKGQLKDYKGALLDLDQADVLVPNDRFTLLERGVVKRLSSDYKGALLDLDRADMLVSNDRFTLFEKGVVTRLLGDYKGALLALDRADVLVPKDGFTLSERGVVKRLLGDYKGALLDLDQANVLVPNDGFTLFERGVVKRLSGDYKGALLDLDCVNKAHEFNSNNASIIRAQAEAQQLLGDYQGPWERMDTAKDLSSDFNMIDIAEELDNIYEESRASKVRKMDCPSVSSNDASTLAWSINLDNNGKESKITVGLTMDVVATRHFQEIGVEEHDATFKSLLQTTLSALENLESVMGRLQQNQKGIKVFHMQCNYLTDTLTTNVGIRLRQYWSLLKLAENPGVMKSVVTHKSTWLRVLSLCIRSLGELVRAFELGVVLVTDCCKTEWWRTAVRLFVVAPQLKQSRWSLFLVVLRQCEWSAEIVELAFGTLKELFACEHVVSLYTVVLKWSEEKLRFVLGKHGKLTRTEFSNVGANHDKVMLEVAKAMEDSDNKNLLQRINKLLDENIVIMRLRPRPRKRKIASFLKQKLEGPSPQASYTCYSLWIDHRDLVHQHYVARGGFGTVAKYKWLGEVVAVKFMDGWVKNKFEKEAAIMSSIQHPSVVKLLGCSFKEETNTGMLVMELMDQDLDFLIKSLCKPQSHDGPTKAPFAIIVAIDIMLQIAEGMQYLKENRIMHRDLKPHNILVNRRMYDKELSLQEGGNLQEGFRSHEFFQVKLTDFGSASYLAHTSSCKSMMVGTTPWRAPEVFDNEGESSKRYTWPADVYSYGIICSQILTGHEPFEGVPRTSIRTKVLAGERPKIEESCPLGLNHLIKRCWAHHPDDRPKFSEICKELWRCKLHNMLDTDLPH